MLAADLTQKEVDAPPDRYCSSGHNLGVLAAYRNKPVRFFQVSGKGVDGVYCEPCLVLANYVARRKRAARR